MDNTKQYRIESKTNTGNDSPLKKGTLYALPLVNPAGFEMIKRENPYDEEDINRNFPGDASGSTTERLASAVFNSIIETKPDLVIDLHADTQNSLPYAIIDRPVSAKAGAGLLSTSSAEMLRDVLSCPGFVPRLRTPLASRTPVRMRIPTVMAMTMGKE